MNKFLKAFFVVPVLFASGYVFAQSAFEGPYISISAAHERNSALSKNGSLVNFTTPSTSDVTAPTSHSNASPIVIGAGYYFPSNSNFLVGVGLDYASQSTTTSDFKYTVTRTGFELSDSNFSISNRLNVFVTPAYAIDKGKLVYLKLGYSMARLQALSPAHASDGPLNGFTSNPKTNVNGYIAGIGYKQHLTQKLHGFVEANYMTYGHTALSTSGTNDAIPAQTMTLTINPNLNSYQLAVGVSYQF